MVLESVIDPLFAPFLGIKPLWTIIILSFVLSVIITLIHKMMTNQELMKSLKQDMKESQKKIKQLRDQPEKAMRLQKEVMHKNMKYMMQSFKPMIITILPIIIIFGWLGNHYSYEPIKPGEEFTTGILFENSEGSVELKVPGNIEIIGEAVKEIKDDKAEWELKGDEGEYILEYIYNEKTYLKEIIVSSLNKYKEPIEIVEDTKVKSINVEMTKLKPFDNFKLFNWKPGWLGTYILFSLVFSIVIRKLLKIH